LRREEDARGVLWGRLGGKKQGGEAAPVGVKRPNWRKGKERRTGTVAVRRVFREQRKGARALGGKDYFLLVLGKNIPRSDRIGKRRELRGGQPEKFRKKYPSRESPNSARYENSRPAPDCPARGAPKKRVWGRGTRESDLE